MVIKRLFLLIVPVLFLSSCLKQSISDALLANPSGGNATMSYSINGIPVSIIVNNDLNGIDGAALYMECTKYASYGGYYDIDASNKAGDAVDFEIDTDSLGIGNYSLDSLSYGAGADYILRHGSQNYYLYSSLDTLSINITSNNGQYISGSFYARLTPSLPSNTWGAPGSVVISNGVFNNIPIGYSQF